MLDAGKEQSYGPVQALEEPQHYAAAGFSFIYSSFKHYLQRPLLLQTEIFKSCIVDACFKWQPQNEGNIIRHYQLSAASQHSFPKFSVIS